MFKTEAPPAPVAPAAPPNPPMFGTQAIKKKGTGGPLQQFDASVLGTTPGAGGTGSKTLLGQ